MTGSWKHFTNGQGRFIGSSMLENGGDVVEALEEAYGMVWYLASLVEENEPYTARMVEEARQRYKEGLQVSPGFTLRAAEQNINWDKAWGENRRAWPDDKED